MPESANVRSLDALRYFHAAVAEFQEEARLCCSAMELQLQKITGWLERDRPEFWKRHTELSERNFAEARVSLHKCQMRRTGDFRPTCHEEKKHVLHCKQELEFARKQPRVIRHWRQVTNHEMNEYRGRSSQLKQILERDLPRLMALLQQSADRIEKYAGVAAPGRSADPAQAASEPTAAGLQTPSASSEHEDGKDTPDESV